VYAPQYEKTHDAGTPSHNLFVFNLFVMCIVFDERQPWMEVGTNHEANKENRRRRKKRVRRASVIS